MTRLLNLLQDISECKISIRFQFERPRIYRFVFVLLILELSISRNVLMNLVKSTPYGTSNFKFYG